MPTKTTRKKRANCDLAQIRSIIKAKYGTHYIDLVEQIVIEKVFAAYKHPRYKRKPLDASIKTAIRREFRKLKAEDSSKRKGRVVRGKAGKGRTFNPSEEYERLIALSPYHHKRDEEPIPDPYGYRKGMKDFSKKENKHPLGDISELSRKTDSELVAATEEMKDLIRKQNALVEDIRILQDRKAKIDAFLNGKETLEILALLRQ
jgi:hypothetical protein